MFEVYMIMFFDILIKSYDHVGEKKNYDITSLIAFFPEKKSTLLELKK